MNLNAAAAETTAVLERAWVQAPTGSTLLPFISALVAGRAYYTPTEAQRQELRVRAAHLRNAAAIKHEVAAKRQA